MRGRGEKRLRVGVRWSPQDRGNRSDLDDSAEVHHRDAIGDPCHRTQIVRNEDVREVMFFSEIGKKLQHLFLKRNIQGGNRFVAENQWRLGGKCTSDGHALALATGEPGREAVGKLSAETDPTQQLDGFRPQGLWDAQTPWRHRLGYASP